LIDAGVDVLVDVREKPMSRKVDFRKGALSERCAAAGILYVGETRLGSTAGQREGLHESGDLSAFFRKYRAFARRYRREALAEIADVCLTKTVALMCYERAHDECHRMVVADLLADMTDLSVVAIC